MSILEWALTLEDLTKEQRDEIGKITAVLSENKAGASRGKSRPKRKHRKK